MKTYSDTRKDKAYAACMAKFRALNNASDSCTTEAEYEQLKASQASERASIHAEIDRIKGKGAGR